jgi:hypothetical protein
MQINKLNRFWASMMVVGVLLSLKPTQAKIVKGGGTKSDVPEWGIELVNRAAQPITFHLSADRKSWDDFDLAPGKNQLFKSDGDQVNNMFIKVATNGRTKEYKLVAPNRYIIKWNEQTHKWEVSKLKPVK